MSEPITLGSIAVAMARTGLHVFPVRVGSKTPATKRGFTAATRNTRTLAKYWRANPNFNIGIATGASGLVVIDCDTGKPWPESAGDKPGNVQDGADMLAVLSERAGVPPESWLHDVPSVVTPSGGMHFFWKAPPGVTIKSSVGKVAPWVDVRAHGGYVVGPWSSTAEGHYQPLIGWDHVVQVDTVDVTTPVSTPVMTSVTLDAPPCPDWLLALLTTSATSANPATSGVADVSDSDPLTVLRRRMAQPMVSDSARYVDRAISGECDRVRAAVNGTRNHTLNAAAYALGRLVGAGLANQADVESALMSAARAVGLSDQEAAGTLRSGIPAGMANPRQVVIGS